MNTPLTSAVTEAVADLITEIDADLEVMKPQHEGLRDYARLNLQEPTKQEIDKVIRLYDERINLMDACRVTLVALQENPVLDTHEVEAAVLADLRDQADTIGSALLLFAAKTTKSLGLHGGATEPK